MNADNAGALSVDSNLIARFDYQKDGMFCMNFRFKMVDSRHGIGYYLFKEDQMILLDCYHNKAKYFECFKNGIPFKRWFRDGVTLYHIDLKYTLALEYFSSYPSNRKPSFYLVEFDYEKERCYFTWQGYLKGHPKTFLLDPKNIGKFASINKFENHDTNQTHHSFYLGQFCNNKVIIDNEPIARLPRSAEDCIHCVKLFDGKLVGIKREHEPRERFDFESVKMSYCVADVEKKCFVKQFEFQLNDEFDLTWFYNGTQYVWTENQCLMFGDKINGRRHLYSFNIFTRQCSIVYFDLNDVYKLSLDQNEMIAIIGVKHAIYNYTTRKPQKLGNIIWIGIRRQSMLLRNDKLYNYAMEKLPLNSELQPFHVTY